MAAPEKTFRDYTPSQSQIYANNRLDYHPALYNAILEHHKSTGGGLNRLIDVGCGPGNVARNLCPHFNETLGLDPSEGMIAAAREIAQTKQETQGIRFHVSTAEDLGLSLDTGPVSEGSVDMIVAATAAHWFDMPKFWKSAARVLKPGGSVAIWGSSNLIVDPSVPNAEVIQKRLDQFEDEIEPYFLPGNVLTRGLYKDLGLPWTVEPRVEGFDQASFYRKDTNDTSEFLAIGAPEVPIVALEAMLGTMSPVTRWREDHPDATGEKDIVRILRRDLERMVRETGVEEGKEKLKGSAQGFLLIVKRV